MVDDCLGYFSALTGPVLEFCGVLLCLFLVPVLVRLLKKIIGFIGRA